MQRYAAACKGAIGKLAQTYPYQLHTNVTMLPVLCMQRHFSLIARGRQVGPVSLPSFATLLQPAFTPPSYAAHDGHTLPMYSRLRIIY
jgi:hypothetical protein